MCTPARYFADRTYDAWEKEARRKRRGIAVFRETAQDAFAVLMETMIQHVRQSACGMCCGTGSIGGTAGDCPVCSC